MKLDIIEYQKTIEQTYDYDFNYNEIKKSLKTHLQDAVSNSVFLLTNWLSQDFYKSKQERLAQFDQDIEDLCFNIYTTLLVQPDPAMELTSAIGLCKTLFKYNCPVAQAKTCAEVLAVLQDIGLYSIFKHNTRKVFMLELDVQLDDETFNKIDRCQYQPPSIVEPIELTKAYDYVSLTKKGSVILGGKLNHQSDVALDSLNKFNQVPLSLNRDLLTSYSEAPPEQWTNADHEKQWQRFVHQSYDVYKDLIQTGNQFYIHHKYDKRGRTYSCGYHVNPQGNSFRKAIIELTHKELVEDVL